MCCGQPAKTLDQWQARWLYDRHLAGERKDMLCAEFRVTSEQFDQLIRVGAQIGPWPIVQAPSIIGPTFTSEAYSHV